MTDAIAVLMPGDMGHAVGRVLAQHGHDVLTCLDGRSERTRGLFEAAGIRDGGDLDAVIAAAGAPFIDAGIIGMAPDGHGPGPRFYVPGSDTGPMQALDAMGFQVRAIGTEPGRASASPVFPPTVCRRRGGNTRFRC